MLDVGVWFKPPDGSGSEASTRRRRFGHSTWFLGHKMFWTYHIQKHAKRQVWLRSDAEMHATSVLSQDPEAPYHDENMAQLVAETVMCLGLKSTRTSHINSCRAAVPVAHLPFGFVRSRTFLGSFILPEAHSKYYTIMVMVPEDRGDSSRGMASV